MDVIKVFTEEPVGLESLVADDDPDARRRQRPADSLEAFLQRQAAPYARAYLAGTHLGSPRRVGLTSLSDDQSWVQPVVSWAGERGWSAFDGSTAQSVLRADVPGVLLRPVQTLALGVGPVPPGALAEAAADEGAQRRDRAGAVRAVLDAGAAVLFPEPAHDGWDWSVFAPAPLAAPLVDAFRRRPGAARCLVAPFQRARGEHKFYLEQWALDDLPAWAEEV